MGESQDTSMGSAIDEKTKISLNMAISIVCALFSGIVYALAGNFAMQSEAKATQAKVEAIEERQDRASSFNLSKFQNIDETNSKLLEKTARIEAMVEALYNDHNRK